MTIDTPDWVRDAVFYQIFPDRFARSARMTPIGPYEPWDAPPTTDGIKGGDLYGVAERLGRAGRPRHHRAVPDPGLQLRLEPSLPRLRLPGGRPDPGRRRGAARAARPGPRARDAGHPRRRLQPLRTGLLAVPPRPRAGRRLTVPGLVPSRPGGPRRLGRAQRLPRPGRDLGPRLARLPGLVGAAGPAQAQHRQSGDARVPARGGRALAALRDRRLAPGRPGRDRRSRLLGRVPAALPGGRPGGLPRRRDLGRGARTGSRAIASTR